MAGLAAAGAAAGTAIMPGIGTAVGGVLGALGDMFGDKKSSAPAPGSAPGSAVPSATNTTTAVYGSGLDGSGWMVNFGGTQTPTYTNTGSRDISASASADAAATVAPPLPNYLAPQGSNGMGMGYVAPAQGLVAGSYVVPWALVAVVGAAVVWRLARRKG